MSIQVRIVAVLLLVMTVLIQLSIVQNLSVQGATADLVVIVVVSIALLSNSVVGATYGFFGGLLVGLVAMLPLGTNAMLGTVMGYFIGRWGEVLITDEHPVPPIIAVASASLFVQVGRPVIDFLVNPAITTPSGSWSTSLLVVLINTALAIPVFVVVRSLFRSVDALGGSAVAGSSGGGA